MALTKQPISINFSKGLDTKTDPFQVPVGNFLALKNSVFDTAGRLSKRNGFDNTTTLPNTLQTTLTSLNGNLLATGSNLYAFSQDTNQWLNQGIVQPVQLSVLPLVRVSTSQSSPDLAVASSGLSCLVYVDNSAAYYQISDSSTGQQIVSRTTLPSTATNPRVFLLGRNFIITFMATVSGSPHLRYIAIPVNNPTNPSSATDISTSSSGLTAGYDGFVANNNLYMAWAGASTTVKLAYLTSTLTVSNAVSIASNTSTLMSVTADTSASTPVIWATFYNSGDTTIKSVAYDQNLVSILATTAIGTVAINEITSVATAGVLTIFYENNNTYSFGAGVKTDYISSITCTRAGTVGSATVILRSVGLASKAFIAESGTKYMVATYGETNQPTYFLIDSSGNIYMRLAYQNGGGYEASQVLPTVSLVGTSYYMPYLIKDFLASVNKGTNLPSGTPSNGIYTQTGINLAKFAINTSGQYSSEIANALHLTGGQLWEYDGVRPVEHGFHVWPENMYATGSSATGSMTAQTYFYVFTYEWTDNAGNLHRSAPSIPYQFTIQASVIFTGNRLSGSNGLTGVTDFTGLQVGQHISGTGIPAGTYITALNVGAQTVEMSQNATSGSGTSTSVTTTPLSTLTLSVPTLRLTYKVAPNPVRIVGYRWSTAQQTYYQFTSLTSPTANNPAVDSVTITDNSADATILGNTLLYTTGGVVENIAAPASVASVLFKNRLFLIDAEDQNLLLYSKQVIQAVPVEMSDLFTIYVAPTTGTQGSTGPMLALGALDDKLIVFKRNAIYYVTGDGPDNTGANNNFSDPIFITASVGCANPNSVVLMPNGLMFQSDKGIWLLGRDLSTTYIGSPVEAFNNQTVRSATTIPDTNQVRFVLDNGMTLMYDYFYNQWGTFTNISAVSACLYQNLHTYLNSYGQVFQESPGSYLDGSSPVLMSFTTSWINLAGLQGYERFYFMYLLGTYHSPFKLSVQMGYDYNPSPQHGVIVTPDNYSPAYGGDAVWGSGQAWGGPGNVFEARVFPQIQKCESFQLTVTESYDASLGALPGQGLSLSGLNLIVGMKKGFRVQKASRSFG